MADINEQLLKAIQNLTAEVNTLKQQAFKPQIEQTAQNLIKSRAVTKNTIVNFIKENAKNPQAVFKKLVDYNIKQGNIVQKQTAPVQKAPAPAPTPKPADPMNFQFGVEQINQVPQVPVSDREYTQRLNDEIASKVNAEDAKFTLKI